VEKTRNRGQSTAQNLSRRRLLQASAAGAIAAGTTIRRAPARGHDARVALARHDSYPFFQALGDLVLTGPTGTNVGDLQVFLRSSRHT
jgi:glycerate-2-kinase